MVPTAKVKMPEIQPAQEVIKDGNSGMDFGGLPDRDLKKNLGCG